ncbi:secreted protein containing Cadherin domain protein, partial [Candidatus Magnetomorum sp. HK-1]
MKNLITFLFLIFLFPNFVIASYVYNSYSPEAEVPINGSILRYVNISNAPSNAIITSVEAKFKYTAFGVVQNYVSVRLNHGSDPGSYGGVSLVSQGSLPEGRPGTYGYKLFNTWNGSNVNSKYYFRFFTSSSSPYAPSIHSIYIVVSYSIPSPPSSPSLYDPSNYSIAFNKTPHYFDWSSPSNASSYQIYVDNHSGFGSPEINETVNSSSLNSYKNLPNNVYFWKVRAINSSGTYGDWSSSRRFVVDTPPSKPSLNSPSSGSSYVQGNSITFKWYSSGYNIARYYLRVVKGTNFNNSPVYDIETSSISKSISTSGWSTGTYTWGVRAIKNAPSGFNQLDYEHEIDWGEYTKRTITIKEPPPPIPNKTTLVSPSNYYIKKNLIPHVFDWNYVSNASIYELIVDNHSGFGSPAIHENPGNSYFSSDENLSDNVYFWKVRAINSSGEGDWSSVRQFTVDTPPNPPTISYPLSGDFTQNDTVIFRWSEISHLYEYSIVIVKGSNFSTTPIISKKPIVNYQSVTFDNWEPGLYSWRVKAIKEAPQGFNQSDYNNIIGWSGADEKTFNIKSQKFDLQVSINSIPTNACQGSSIPVQCTVSITGGQLPLDSNFVRVYLYFSQNSTSINGANLVCGDACKFDFSKSNLSDGSEIKVKYITVPNDLIGHQMVIAKVDGPQFWKNDETNIVNNLASSEIFNVWQEGTPPEDNGVLARTWDNSKVYWIKYGKKFWIKSGIILEKLGYSDADIKWFNSDVLNENDFPNGNDIFNKDATFTYRSYDKSTVYVIKSDGKSYPFYTWKEYKNADFDEDGKDIYWANSTAFSYLQGSNDLDEELHGYLDNADCDNNIRGWAASTKTTDPIKVRIYADGVMGSGLLIDEVTANVLRADLQTDDKNHGFELEIPMSLKNGQAHSIYAYAVGSDNVSTEELNQSGRTFSCQGWEVGVPPGDDGILAKTYDNSSVYWIKYNRIWHVLGSLDGENPFRKLGYEDQNIRIYGTDAFGDFIEANEIPSNNGTFCYKKESDDAFNVYLVKGSKSYKFKNKYSFCTSDFKDHDIFLALDTGFNWLQNKYPVAGFEEKPYNIEISSSSPLRIDPSRTNPSRSYALPSLDEFNGQPIDLEKNFKVSFKITNPENCPVTIDDWGIYVSGGNNTNFYLTNESPITLDAGEESPKFDLRGFITDDQLTGTYSTTYSAKVVVKINGQWIDVNGGGNTAVFLVYRRPNIQNYSLVKTPDSPNIYYTQHGYKWKIANEIAASQLNSNWKQEYYVYPKTIIRQLSSPITPLYSDTIPQIPGENLLIKKGPDVYIIESDLSKLVMKHFEDEPAFYNYGYPSGSLGTQPVEVDQTMFDWLKNEYDLVQEEIKEEQKYIEFTYPSNGTVWEKGKRVKITWDTNLDSSVFIEIFVENNYGTAKTLDQTNASNKLFYWTFDQDFLANTNYILRLKDSASDIMSDVQISFEETPLIAIIAEPIDVDDPISHFEIPVHFYSGGVPSSWECNVPDGFEFKRYEYKVDGEFTLNPYSTKFKNLVNGEHVLQVRCADNSNSHSEWKSFTFKVANDENKNKLETGVTVITHGWQHGGSEGAIPPEWAIQMGVAILKKVGKGSLFIHDPETGEWLSLKDSKFAKIKSKDIKEWRDNGEKCKNTNKVDDEIVLIFNWVWESDDSLFGWLTSAADSLFASLLIPPKDLYTKENLLKTKPFHFIGHSRGAVLNLETIKLIGHFFQEKIDHFTSLDPHPWSSANDPGYEFKNSHIQIPDNISFSDNYYRQDLLYENDFDFNGVKAIDANCNETIASECNLELKEEILEGSSHFRKTIVSCIKNNISTDRDELNCLTNTVDQLPFVLLDLDRLFLSYVNHDMLVTDENIVDIFRNNYLSCLNNSLFCYQEIKEEVNRFNNSGAEFFWEGQEHADVHLWYYGTIDTSPDAYDGKYYVPKNFYSKKGMGPRDKVGYYHSRLSGRDRTVDNNTNRNLTTPGYIVVNGDFSYFDAYRSDDVYIPLYIPGWERHGGGGTGLVENKHLTLKNMYSTRKHNSFYIPENSLYFSFKFKTVETEKQFENVDRLYFKLIIEDANIPNFIYKHTLNSVTDDYITKIFDIKKFSDSIATIEFGIQKGGEKINSEVWIDNVEIYTNDTIDDLLITLGNYNVPFSIIGEVPSEIQTNISFRSVFVKAYLNENGALGQPFDNGSTIFVHDWNGIFIQDFRGEIYGESALIFNSNNNEAYALKNKFWEKYKENGNGPIEYGMPKTNEISNPNHDVVIQYFEKGFMYYSPTLGDNVYFNIKKSDPQRFCRADFDLENKEGIEKIRYQCLVVNPYARKRTIQWIEIGIDDSPQDDFQWISGISEAEIKVRAQIFDGQNWSDEWYTSNQTRYIDNLPPVTTDNSDDSWNTEPFSISLTVFDGNAIDSNTGVNTYYSIDNTTPDQAGSLISISESGIYTIQYFSVDASGNAEAIKTASFQAKLDQEGPIFRSTKTEPQDLCDSYGNDYIITSDIIDPVSGIQGQIPHISYRFSTTDDSTLQPMTGIDNNTFMFTIPQPEKGWGILSDQILYYTITCNDVAGNTTYFKGSEYINPIDGPFLTVTPSHLEIPSINGISVLNISNSGINDLDWSVLSDTSWLTIISSTTGISDDRIVISYDHNDTGISRAATLTVTSQSAENSLQTVEYIQQGEDSHIIRIPEDQTTIQAGIDIAADGDVILVQPGSYPENLNFKGKTISVGSLFLVTGNTDYITQTIINGGQNGSVVSFISGENQHSVLNGFTLTNGSGSNQYSSTGFDGGAIVCQQSGPVLSNLIIDNNEADYGSGISCIQNASPILANVLIKNNHARKNGGALFMSDESTPIIAKSTFINNTANESGAGIYCINGTDLWLKNSNVSYNNAAIKGGGIYLDHSTGLFSHLTIANNQASGEDGTGGGLYVIKKSDASFFNVTISNNDAVNKGGGVYCETSDPIMTGSSITNNSAGRGGGFYCSSFSNPVLTGVDIVNNSATSDINGDGGGIICLNSAPVLNNVLIVRNVSNAFGAGIQASNNANPILNNVTIADNTSTNGNGAIFCANNSHVTLNNAIVWNNSPNNISFADWNIENSISINYSDIQDGMDGIATNNNGTVQWNNGNLSIEPIFVNNDTNNYHLQSNSSCINAGDPEAVFANEPIYNGNRINLGRYGNTAEATSTIPPFVLTASYHSVTLPTTKGSYTITVMNSGSGSMKWKSTTDVSWLILKEDSGTNDGDCSFQYQTNTEEERKATILITATEAKNLTYSIDITQLENKSPEISEIDNQTINEDTFHQLSFDATDIETGLLNAYVLSSDTDLIPYQNISLANNGERYTLSILPKTDQSGSCELTITIDDSYNSIFKSFSVFVSAINDAPESQNYSFTVVENSLQGTFIGTIEGEDVDENDALSYSIVDGNTENAFDIHNETGTLTVNNSNAINCESNLSYTLTVGISDDITTVYSNVLVSINAIPVANSASLTVTEDQSISSSLTGTDINGDPLTFQIVTQPEKGDITLTNTSSGDFTYIPNLDATGNDVFGFIISDGNASSLTALVSINIQSVDDVPVINIPLDDVSVNEDTIMDCLNLTPVFTDIDNNDEAIVHKILSISNPDILTATILGNSLCLTLLENQNGLSTIEIAGFSNGQSVTDAFEVLVHPINDSPLIISDSVSMTDQLANGSVFADQTIDEDFSVTITFTISDSETANSNLIVSGNCSNLTLINRSNFKIEGTGASRVLSLTPTSNENGTAIIHLSVTDGDLTTTTSFTLTVNAINDSPIISTIEDQTIEEDTPLNQISFTVSDVESSDLIVSGSSSN